MKLQIAGAAVRAHRAGAIENAAPPGEAPTIVATDST